ncbi:hypothetical protein JW613_10005 [Streptomyces smyrnaeus]|uniref:SPOR domain-containing protein n=1 Tax=Streptomyces smyrnaeus TaxID=1387713 RepID=A0ABS3XUG9_9ACTN|nr:hypothetical protein [Streptomyces smyrnaeus]MBO8198637.1 hypothetical protein [Streptomyces smyrnaeus]
MPDDVGGRPFPDGEEPEYRDHGAADDEFASVVLDEDFVRAAEVHEPSAAERILASAQSHAELTENENLRSAEDGVGRARGEGELPHDDLTEADDPFYDDPDDDEGRFDRSDYRVEYEGTDGLPPELDPAYEHGADFGYPHGAHGRYTPHGGGARPYRGHRSWQRPVAWVLAVVMGIGMVALAFSAVYRGTSNQRQDPTPPPATTGVDREGPGALPTVSVEPPGG